MVAFSHSQFVLSSTVALLVLSVSVLYTESSDVFVVLVRHALCMQYRVTLPSVSETLVVLGDVTRIRLIVFFFGQVDFKCLRLVE